MSEPFRFRMGGVSLVGGAIALFAAQTTRPDTGETAESILASVAASPDAAGAASLLYLATAAALVAGFVAVPALATSGRGSRLLFVASAIAAVGAVWYGVEAALMHFGAVLATSPDAASAASQLDRLNAGMGHLAVLPWLFYLAPLGVAIGLRRAGVVGSWLIGLWVASFVAGFAAESPLGAEVPVLVIVNDVLLAGFVAAIGVVVGLRSRDEVVAVTSAVRSASVA